MSKTTIALGIIVVVCTVTAIYLLTYYQPRGKPEFEIVSFELSEPSGQFPYRVSFKLKNVGTEDATGIYGIIIVGSWNKTWYLEDYPLKPGQASYWITVWKEEKPTDPTATIIVYCNQGVTRQFTEPLPT